MSDGVDLARRVLDDPIESGDARTLAQAVLDLSEDKARYLDAINRLVARNSDNWRGRVKYRRWVKGEQRGKDRWIRRYVDCRVERDAYREALERILGPRGQDYDGVWLDPQCHCAVIARTALEPHDPLGYIAHGGEEVKP